MNKLICDVCKKNAADKCYKIKELKGRFINGDIVNKWTRIDICQSCLDMLLDNSNSDGSDLCDYYITLKDSIHPDKHVCYGTKEAEECTCSGHKSQCNFYPLKRNPTK